MHDQKTQTAFGDLPTTIYNMVGQVSQRGIPMIEINVYEAKTQLSKYLSMLSSGQEKEIIIMKNGKRIARLIPEKPMGVRLGAGSYRGEFKDHDLKDPIFDIEGEFDL